MKDDKALIKELKAEREALVGELKDARIKAKEAERRAFDAEIKAKKTIGKSADRENRATEFEAAAKARYEISIKELKLFCDRIKRLFESGESILKKAEIIDLFKDFLKKEKGVSAKETIDMVSKVLGKDEEKDLDLDDILNFKGDADLQKLCEDLGVYKGED